MRIPIPEPSGWTSDKAAAAKLASVRLIIETLLTLKGRVDRRYLTRFLSNALWQATQADGGKYGIRYCSKAAIGQPQRMLHHEHVHTRKTLVAALLSGEPVESVLNRAIACVVTREEHKCLTKGDGWERYDEAGIVVIDRKTGKQRP